MSHIPKPAYLLVSCLIGACGPAPEPLGPGHVTVPWLIPPRGCEAASVDTVEVMIAGAEGTLTARAACDAGELVMEEVPFGRYALTVHGLSHNTIVHDAPQALLVVRPDLATLAPAAILSARPATLDLRWSLPAAGCAAAGATAVLIGLYDDAGAVIQTHTAPCDAGVARLTGIPAGAWTLGLTSVPAGPSAHAPLILERGQLSTLSIDLD
jgi:hypothetical protein